MLEKRQVNVYLPGTLIRRIKLMALKREASLSAFVERALGARVDFRSGHGSVMGLGGAMLALHLGAGEGHAVVGRVGLAMNSTASKLSRQRPSHQRHSGTWLIPYLQTSNRHPVLSMSAVSPSTVAELLTGGCPGRSLLLESSTSYGT